MYNILSNLIRKHYYKTREEAEQKVSVCFAMNKLTQDQYSDLMMLIDEEYPEMPEVVEEAPQEEA